MSARTRNIVIVVVIVLVALKFRNQLVELVQKVPVLGPLIA